MEEAKVTEMEVSDRTLSGVEPEQVYGPEGEEFPGEWPYTRGLFDEGYRGKLWTMRMFAGFGTAEESNKRFRGLLKSGGTGLSVAFDLPTLMGRDSDDELAVGEVGKAGVAVDTLADMEDLFKGIDLGEISTSMTINSPAAILLAMYVAVAEKQGVEAGQLRGTIQNDILKEYQAQKEFIFPPRASLRLVGDVVEFCEREMPLWHPISVSGYHIREAGADAVEELAFTLANGFAYVELMGSKGMEVDAFGKRLSFFFNAQIDFFEEIAKYRAARRIWAKWMRDRYGAKDTRAMMLRFHTQTSGVSLTAQQPEVNIARVAIEALAGVMGGTQSLHTDAYDEALALPSEKAARIALRTQQVIAYETGVASVADPLGGSYLVEELTDELERRAEEIFEEIEEMGDGSMLEGVITGIEEGWFQREIGDAAAEFERRVNEGTRVVVGVNRFRERREEGSETLYIGPEVEKIQVARLREIKRSRNMERVEVALDRVGRDAGRGDVNLMPAISEAVEAYATVGEIVGALREVFGAWSEPSVV